MNDDPATEALAAPTRQPGYYWVRSGDGWRPCWVNADGRSYEQGGTFPLGNSKIGPRLLNPDELADHAALAERLRSVIFAALMLRDHRADEEMGMEIDDETDLLVKAITDAGLLSPVGQSG